MGFIWTVLRGVVAGGIATWVMDKVTTRIYEHTSEEDKELEQAAWPNGKPSVGNLVDLGSRLTGIQVSKELRPQVELATHYLLGIGPAVLYALLRKRVPMLGAGRGLVYGLALFVVNDELLNAGLGLSGPPDAYPMSSHVRGFAGHIVLGVVTDLALT